ncbi:hypothetical protein [Nonomuraea sp. NPDC049480]|uniref:hypothetical protein n=1 Tax=Nonomuraea sp. NPDC049480 TaxID=3364353 RepID=UPI0037B60494
MPERPQECFGHQVVADVWAESSGDVAVYLCGVPVIEFREPFRFAAGRLDQSGVIGRGEGAGDHAGFGFLMELLGEMTSTPFSRTHPPSSKSFRLLPLEHQRSHSGQAQVFVASWRE